MAATDLLSRFADPNIIETLSMSDKLTAGLFTTLLGMGITFVALIILQFIISWMEKLLNRPVAPAPASPATGQTRQQGAEAAAGPDGEDPDELVAVIASVLAMHLKTSVSNIIIRNIEKTEDHSPAWNRAGIIDQMNSRF